MPSLGGLRPTASMPLQPSVQIHADVANAIMTGFVPYRGSHLPLDRSGLQLWQRESLPPMRQPGSARNGVPYAGGRGGARIQSPSAGAIYASTGWLFDAVGTSLALIAVLIVTSALQLARTRRAEATARRKFSQYLPQSVVARYIDEPDRERLAGEERPVTALFTDIEGFSTAFAKAWSPRTRGPARHLFRRGERARLRAWRHGRQGRRRCRPCSLQRARGPARPRRQGDRLRRSDPCFLPRRCADARNSPNTVSAGPASASKPGAAVLGEVGAGGKLDYTAHGDAVNLAARLQEANKFLGTAICIGPAAAAQSKAALTIPWAGMTSGASDRSSYFTVAGDGLNKHLRAE